MNDTSNSSAVDGRAMAGSRGRLATLLIACACWCDVIGTARAADWPALVLPQETRRFDVGQQVTLNGMPMRLQGFVSELPPRAVADSFRHAWGKPLVETMQGGKLVLGRMQDEHHLVVQIEAAGSGSRGIVAVSHLKAAYERQAATQAEAQRWLDRLPAGSRLLSDMASQDAGRVSRHLVFMNAQSEPLNRDRLVDLLADEGFVLDREGTSGDEAAGARLERLVTGHLLFFKGPRKEATATIHRDAGGTTTTVLNLVTALERTP